MDSVLLTISFRTSSRQAQEAWHKKFKGHIGTLHMAMPEFYDRLKAYCGWYLEQLQLETTPFPDLPTEPFPDSLLLDEDRMESLGRSAAQEFLQPQCMSEWQDTNGTHYFAMRPHLHTWNAVTKIWEKTVHPRTTERAAAQHMAKLITADTASTVQAALRSLGAGNVVGADMQKLRVAVSRYVVASFGPAAAKYWAQPTQAPSVHPHGQGLCAFCLEAALHCTCEHIYAGLIRLRIATFP